MHEASLYQRLDQNRVQCRLCSHFCRIEDNETGKCGVRKNEGGVLHTLVYDRVAAVNLDPVEKKPLYHFLPGTFTFSFGAMGCNLGCAFCQNDTLSQPPRQGRRVAGQHATPEQLVEAARMRGAQSVSYTYSEPTVFFELVRDTADLAHAAGLKNILVSNGFMSPQCLEELRGRIDAANIDLKAFTEDFYRDLCQARLEPVLHNLKAIKQMGWWLEVTTLVIPGRNDSDEELGHIAAFVANELGADTPWHISRFHPCYRLTDAPPTPAATLERAHAVGKAAGLQFVYVGNAPGHPANNTYCPVCGKLVLGRAGFRVDPEARLDGVCPHCGHRLAGVWRA
ncbi:MAG: AmmeMemoRadiSam system radical SAM enzyme [Desulfovibrionaceae bacterium]